MSSTSVNGKFFEVLSANPIDLTLTAHSPVTYNQLPCAVPDGVQIGNFDHQQPDPTKSGSTEHDPNSQIAFLACSANAASATLNIYSVDPKTFDVQSTPRLPSWRTF